MVFGFGDTLSSNLCGDSSNNDFLEKRIFGRDFVVSNGIILFIDELASLDNLYTCNNYWWIEFVVK